MKFLAFYMVLAIPLLRLLVRAHYDVWRPEVLAVLALFALPSFALSRLPGGKPAFLGALSVWAAFFSATSVRAQIWPALTWILAFAALAFLSLGATALFRDRFPALLGLMLGGMFGAEVWLASTAGRAGTSPPAAAERLPHTIYLVLDEQTGIAGFPPLIQECADAASIWRTTMERHGFTLYPNAYSNYSVTWHSLPSILNDQLLRPKGLYMLEGNLLAGNVLFARATARGQDIALYQSDYVRFNLPRYRYSLVREYDFNDVSALLESTATWSERARHILTWYFLLDRPIALLVHEYSPGLPLTVRTGPLSVRKFWPRAIAEDVLRARRPTLFFVHLLSPHAPYILDAQGNVRPYREWPQQTEYTREYRNYCGQSAFLARQLDEFFGTLQRGGVLEAARVVVHGDHGSRVKKYSAEPTLRELLDSFSAMLAIRQPRPGQARIDTTKASLLSLLRQSEGRPGGTEQDLDNVFLGSQEEAGESDIGDLRPASIRDLWKE